jgi:hypothetical protein
LRREGRGFARRFGGLGGTTRSPMCSGGSLSSSAAGLAGSPRSPARSTSSSAQRSLSAEIVSDGFTPSDVGTNRGYVVAVDAEVLADLGRHRGQRLLR